MYIGLLANFAHQILRTYSNIKLVYFYRQFTLHNDSYTFSDFQAYPFQVNLYHFQVIYLMNIYGTCFFYTLLFIPNEH